MTDSAQPKYAKDSLYGMGTGIVCAVIVGGVASKAGAPPQVTSVLASASLALPAAIEFHLQSRGQTPKAEVAELKAGQTTRPSWAVVGLFAAAIILADSIVGAFVGAAGGQGYLPLVAVGAIGFAIANRASHYLGERPYMQTLAAVAIALVVRMIILSMAWSWIRNAVEFGGGTVDKGEFMVDAVVGYLIMLPFCLAGTWWGRKHHDQWVAKRLAKLGHQ
jgi:hypothetical protein